MKVEVRRAPPPPPPPEDVIVLTLSRDEARFICGMAGYTSVTNGLASHIYTELREKCGFTLDEVGMFVGTLSLKKKQ